MRVADLAKEYQSKTDDELLCLASDSEHLTSEAKSCLTSELIRRGFNEERLRTFREEGKLSAIGVLEAPQQVASTPVVPGNELYAIGPVLAAERTKAPWRPRTAGWIAFFFGPFAGAQVAAISLGRMGYQRSGKKVHLLALGMAIAMGIILFFPTLSRD